MFAVLIIISVNVFEMSKVINFPSSKNDRQTNWIDHLQLKLQMK